MATAICKQCGKLLYWHAGRGYKLSGYVCACGGRYGAATWDETTGLWVLRKSTGNSSPMIQCALCGRKRRSGGSHVRTTEGEAVLVDHIFNDNQPVFSVEKRIPSGAQVCAWHNVHHVQIATIRDARRLATYIYPLLPMDCDRAKLIVEHAKRLGFQWIDGEFEEYCRIYAANPYAALSFNNSLLLSGVNREQTNNHYQLRR